MYTPASFIMFPRWIITMTAVLAFDQWHGLRVCAFAGVIIAGICTFLPGRMVSRDTIRRLAGAKLKPLMHFMERKGLIAVTILRVDAHRALPHRELRDGRHAREALAFRSARIIGMMPGMLAATVLSEQLAAALEDPTRVNFWLIGAAVLVIVCRRLLRPTLLRRHGARTERAHAVPFASPRYNVHRPSAATAVRTAGASWGAERDRSRMSMPCRKSRRMTAAATCSRGSPASGADAIAGTTLLRHDGTTATGCLARCRCIGEASSWTSAGAGASRAAIPADLDFGEGRMLTVVATHLGPEARGAPRAGRSASLELFTWHEQERAVLMGDLNEWLPLGTATEAPASLFRPHAGGGDISWASWCWHSIASDASRFDPAGSKRTRRRLRGVASDHLPLVASIEI